VIHVPITSSVAFIFIFASLSRGCFGGRFNKYWISINKTSNLNGLLMFMLFQIRFIVCESRISGTSGISIEII